MRNNTMIDRYFDLCVWFWLQGYFMPFYIIGKQDEWGQWISTSSLNGIKGNICRPY